MKKATGIFLSGFVALFLLAAATFAQETTEITVQVKKDGKVLKDTTYHFEDETDAKHVIKMVEMLSGDGLKELEYNYTTALSDDSDSKVMVVISKDGEKTEIREMTGDSLVWVSEGEEGDGPVKVMTYKVETEGEPGMNGKRIKVVVTEDEDGVTHISEEEMVESEEEVYVISGDESEKELKEIMEKVKSEEEEENVKVIVIKKKDKSKQ